MKNEKKVEEICRQEKKLLAIKEWLVVSFFLASAVVVWVYISALMDRAADPLLNIEQDRVVATKIITTLFTFAVTIIAGYLYNKALSKKLDRLWEKKSVLF